MISHKYKCIYLHIPRTAGTSIEALLHPELLHGNRVCEVNEKHYTWHQAKEKYKDYWNDYFKFSFVRNPFDRVVSCLIYPEYFRITYDDGFNFDGYKAKFGYPNCILEVDDRTDIDVTNTTLKSGSVYGNFIGDEMDFIGKFETLEKDMEYVKNILGVKGDLQKLVPSERKPYQEYFKKIKDITEVLNLYHKDMQRFDYGVNI